MPSEIKSQARRERFLLTYNVCFGTFGGVLRERSVHCGPGLCAVKGSLPAWHLKVSTGGKRITYSHIWAGARLPPLKLTSSSVEKRDTLRSTAVTKKS